MQKIMALLRALRQARFQVFLPAHQPADAAVQFQAAQEFMETRGVKQRTGDHMQNPFEDLDAVEDLLVNVWYPWTTRGCRPPRLKGSAMFRDIPPARGAVWDDMDEREVRLARIKAERTQWCIDRLTTMQAVAVDLHCANRLGGVVWRSGRLSPEQAMDLYQEAKAALIPDLIAKELIPNDYATAGACLPGRSGLGCAA